MDMDMSSECALLLGHGRRGRRLLLKNWGTLSQGRFRTLLAKHRARPYRADRVHILLRNTRG